MSFTPETKVTTDEGKEPIGTLQEGDQVLAYDPETQQARLQPVTHIWINTDYDLLDLTVTTVEQSQNGTETLVSEIIHTNKEHPFLTKERGFLSAGELILGMHLVRADGSVGTVSGWQVVAGSKKMYNLEVAQDHTFTVGDGQWVVHNKKCNKGGLKKVSDAYLKQMGIDAHQLKQDTLSKNASISHYDIYMDKKKNLYLLEKGGKGDPIETYYNLNDYAQDV